jgi:glutamyl-tRNA reductase
LKAKLNLSIGTDFQSKKISNFNEEQGDNQQTESSKITTHFANHLKDDDTMVDESIEWIEKVQDWCYCKINS